MTDNPFALSSEFDDFTATNQDSFAVNKPEGNTYSDRFNWWSSEIKLAQPPMDTQSQYRIIPWPGLGYFAVPVRLHEGIGIEKNSCPCPKMLGPEKDCPFCRYARECYQKQLKELGGKFNGKERWLMWVIDRKNPSLGPLLARIPKQTIDLIRNLLTDPRTGQVRPVDHLDAGFDIFFTRRKTEGGFPMWLDIQIDTMPTPLGSRDQVAGWLSYVRSHANLADILVYLPSEQMDTLAGMDPWDDATGGEEEITVAPTPAVMGTTTVPMVTGGTGVTTAAPAATGAPQPAPQVPPAIDPSQIDPAALAAAMALLQQQQAQTAGGVPQTADTVASATSSAPSAAPVPAMASAPAAPAIGGVDVNALKEQLKQRPKS